MHLSLVPTVKQKISISDHGERLRKRGVRSDLCRFCIKASLHLISENPSNCLHLNFLSWCVILFIVRTVLKYRVTLSYDFATSHVSHRFRNSHSLGKKVLICEMSASLQYLLISPVFVKSRYHRASMQTIPIFLSPFICDWCSCKSGIDFLLRFCIQIGRTNITKGLKSFAQP